MSVYKVAGVMSGTSLDGLDIACCTFTQNKDQWQYVINKATTIAYPEDLRKLLASLNQNSAELLAEAHFSFGKFIGQNVNQICEANNFKPEIISSHGHTISHAPEKGYTFQLGHGGAINAVTGKKVVNDFRSQDVALGGQGAPLVPCGETALFTEYDFCINLGGIANITCLRENPILAWDIAPCNIILNYIAAKENQPYDKDGIISNKGSVQSKLLEKLNNIPWYQNTSPKSLDKQQILDQYLPMLELDKHSLADVAATWCEHVTFQILQTIMKYTNGNDYSAPKILVTGGGAFHPVIMKSLNKAQNLTFVVPDKTLVEYKEAMIFAYLGLRRILGLNNVYASVTGALYDHSAGAVYS